MRYLKSLFPVSLILFYFTVQIHASFKNDTLEAGNLCRKAVVLADSSHYDSALAYFNRAASIYKNHKVWEKYLSCRNKIFRYSREKGVKYDVKTFVFENLDLAIKKLGNENPVTGICFSQVGNYYSDQESFDTAIIYFQKALQDWNCNFQKNKDLISSAYLNLGLMLAEKAQYDSSLACYDKALDVRQKEYGENNLGVAEVYNGKGSLYYYLGDFNKCLENFNKVLEIKRNLFGNNHPEVAKAYNNIGAAYEAMGKNFEALDVDQAALKIRLATLGPNHFNVALSYNNIGNIYSNLGQYALSNEYHFKALQIRLKLFNEDHNDVIMSYTNLGINYMFMGIYDEAMKMLQKVLAFDLKKYGEYNPQTANGYNNMGTVFEGMGEWDSALFYFNKALNIRLKIFSPHHPSLAGSYNNIGSVCKSKGDYEASLRYFFEALTIIKESYSNENPKLASAFTNIGAVYIELKNYNKAIDYLNKSLELRKKLLGGDSPELASTYSNIANIYSCQNKNHEAEEYELKAISIVQKSVGEVHPKIASYYSNLAATYFDMHDTAKALATQQKAIDIYNKIYAGKYFGLAMAYDNLGDFQFENKQYQAALKNYQFALIANNMQFSSFDISQNPNPESTLDKPEMLKTLQKKSGTLFKLYFQNGKIENLKIAFSTINKAVSLIENIRQSYKLNESKLFFVQECSGVFSLASNISFACYAKTNNTDYLNNLFKISQQSKAQVLSEAIQQSRVIQFAGIPDSIVSLERESKNLLDAAESRLLLLKYEEKSDSLTIKKLEEKVFQYSIKYKNISDLIEAKYPRFKEMIGNSSVPSLDEVQKKLNKETALLDYFISDSVLYVFCITNSKVTIGNISIDSSFEESVKNLVSGIRKNREEQFKNNSTNIYQKLIGPVVQNLTGIQNLLIIPDKFLLYLPFEVLLKSSNYKQQGQDKNDYLIRHYDIIYNYSAALAFNKANRSGNSNDINSIKIDDFIGFAPVFNNTSNKIFTYTGTDTLSKEYTAMRSVTLGDMSLKPLLNTEKEVKTIVNLFSGNKLKSIGFFHDSASINNFKKEIGHYKYIHIATHGISNDEYPSLSGLVFSPEKSDSISGNKFQNSSCMLFANEIYNLNLRADLVVLSACESGTGKLVKGEGLMSITRGFIFAGVPKIIYSLWKVDDKSTCDLMTNFYAALLQNKTTGQALREAKLKLLDNPATSFPKFWAAFALLGN